jgi:hypothetical protein
MATQSAIFKRANELIREGYDRKQAFAVAYSENGEPKRARKNPAPKRKTAARTQKAAIGYVNRPSQITKKAPSKRLKKRRTINLQTPRGVFPNPGKLVSRYDVQYFDMYGKPEHMPFHYKKDAMEFAKDKIEATIFDRQLNKNVWSNSMAGKGPFNNPSSVHFDIDVNSHNARGSKAKTRVNPTKRIKEITVEQSLDKKHWTIFARFPDTPDGSNNAIEYAKAYAKKEPYLHIRVMTNER